MLLIPPVIDPESCQHRLSSVNSKNSAIVMHIIYQDLGDVPMPPANNDWEDVIADLAGPEMQGAEDMQDIIHDLRGIAMSSYEVKAQPSANAEEDEGREMETVEGDPTDGETSPGLSTCTNNWKAVAKEENKKMWAIFAESGIFASACHHGFILWICDMIMSGE
ncbi:hypothetical protein C0995_008700, partial [Termitomyces sp. Mi166